MTRTRRLALVVALNLALVAALVVVGLTARSLAVFAEGGDYLLDAAGAALAIFATRSVAALVNAGWLVVLELLVAAGAVDRLLTTTPRVDGLAVLVVSAIAAVVMTIGALILRPATGGDDDDDDDDADLSVAAVLLDTVADAAAAAGVAITGAIIFATGRLFWLDPAVALLIAVVIGWHALALIRKVLSRNGPA